MTAPDPLEDQDRTLLLGFVAGIIGNRLELCGEMTLTPDQIELRSPWSGNLYALKLVRLQEPKAPRKR